MPKTYFTKLTKETILRNEVDIEIDWKNQRIYCPNCAWTLNINIP